MSNNVPLNDLPAGVFGGRAATKAVDPQCLHDPFALMVAVETLPSRLPASTPLGLSPFPRRDTLDGRGSKLRGRDLFWNRFGA